MDGRTMDAAVLAGQEAPAWAAVLAMTLGVFGLVTAEFLPASLLTPMAGSLGVTEGAAGQAVTVTAVLALVSALLAPSVTAKLDRRFVLWGFSVLLVASNLLVVTAPGLPALLLARVLLGVALGGFWSMATAITMRLVPPHAVPRALSILFSGVSVATIVAAPLGSFIGGHLGWRAAFVLGAGIGLLSLAVQVATLPRLPPTGTTRLRTLGEVLRRRGVALGIGCTVGVFGGHFALFTYVRPYLEDVSGLGVDGLSLMLLVFGVANFVGTFAAGALLGRGMRPVLLGVPLLMAAAALGLAVFPAGGGGAHAVLADRFGQVVLVACWGLGFGGVPVGWSSWLARAVPDQAESAGGLLVAAVQLAIAGGAAAGGLLFAVAGARGTFAGGGLVLVAAAALVAARVRVGTGAIREGS